MQRAERLIVLVDTLRRHRWPVTASALSEQLGVSTRTIYRDIQSLIGLGAPIDGEAGVGYLLRKGFFMPPLMFSPVELEALLLGARWVGQQGDKELADAANSALDKIATAVPPALREVLEDTGLWAGPSSAPRRGEPLFVLRRALREELKLRIVYRDVEGRETERTVWPLTLAFFEGARILAAWCELRQDFRHFRTDRIADLQVMEESYPGSRRLLAQRWLQAERQRRSRKES